METITVGLLQMASCGWDAQANLDKADHFCRLAAKAGADIALLPEMWNVGYKAFEGLEAEAVQSWQNLAMPTEGPWVQHFVALAEELDMGIGVTYLQRWPGAPRNTISLVDRHGQLQFSYAKVHTCDFAAMETACTPGDDFYVADLDTAKGTIKVGAMICYDREFPESARTLMLKGAELVLTPNACGLEGIRLTQFRSRAFENALAVAMTNYAAPDQNGQSVVYNADGKTVVQAGEKEGLYLAPLDFEEIRRYRQETIWGNAYRRPHRYDLLLGTDVDPVFARKDGFGKDFDRANR